jgi:uncharacterized Zn finger protein (UPF0148 family)
MGGIKMKYCSKCGSPINDDAVFCAGCGTRVSDNNTNQNAENLQPTAEQTTNEENPNVTNTVPLQQQSVYAQGVKQKKNVGLYEKYSFLLNVATLLSLLSTCIFFVLTASTIQKYLFQYDYLYECFSIISLGLWACIMFLAYSFVSLSVFFAVKKKRNIYSKSNSTEEICHKFDLQHTSITVLLVVTSILAGVLFTYYVICFSGKVYFVEFLLLLCFAFTIISLIVTMIVIKNTGKNRAQIVVHCKPVNEKFVVKHRYVIVECAIVIVISIYAIISITGFYNPINVVKRANIRCDINDNKPVEIPYGTTIGDLLNTYDNYQFTVNESDYKYEVRVVAHKGDRIDEMTFMYNKGQFFFLSDSLSRLDTEIYKGALVDNNVMVTGCTFQDTDYEKYSVTRDSEKSAIALYLICVERFNLAQS